MSLTTVRDETVEAFLGQLAARVSAPGGGATAALHAAQADQPVKSLAGGRWRGSRWRGSRCLGRSSRRTSGRGRRPRRRN